MIIVEYYLVQWFGWINGTGIASMCWLLSMEILTRRLEHREAKAHAKYKIKGTGAIWDGPAR